MIFVKFSKRNVFTLACDSVQRGGLCPVGGGGSLCLQGLCPQGSLSTGGSLSTRGLCPQGASVQG